MQLKTTCLTLAVAAMLSAAGSAMAQATCRADIDGDGELTVFDFLEFQNLFDTGDLAADFDGDGRLTVFDFLEFQNDFVRGCPAARVSLQMAGVPLDEYPHFEATRAFNEGDTVYLAIDPDRFPAIRGVTGDIYIVQSKTDLEWAGDPSLTDVRGMPQAHTFNALSIDGAEVALTGSEALAAADGLDISTGYDLVVDVDRDGTLSDGDYIDGLGVAPADANGFSVFTNISEMGPLTPTMVDSSSSQGVLRLNYPAELADVGPLPIVVIVHGGGHDYRWYDYLQDQLSSWGWVSISVQNDFSGTGNRPLRHTDALIGEQATIAGGVLNGLLDSSRIVWIGHSLGGRECNIGSERLSEGSFTPTNYSADDMVLVSSIAANSSGGSGFEADPGDINFHMIWGSADGDISGSPSSFGGQTIPFRNYDRADGNKHSTYVHGADHNVFNCCGFRNFQGPISTEIGRAEAQQIAKATWTALIKHYGEGNGDAIDYVTRAWDSFKPLGVIDSTTLVHMYRPITVDGDSRVIDDFQSNPSLSQSSSGGSVTIGVSNAAEVRQEDLNGSLSWTGSEPSNGMNYAFLSSDDSTGLVFDFNNPSFIEFQVLPALGDVSGYDHLSFRTCQGTRHPNTIAELEPVTFNVVLVDTSGARSEIHVGAYEAGASEPYQRTGAGTGTGWQNEYGTIRVRLTDFLAQNTGLDLADIAAIRFEFAQGQGSTIGRLGLDEIEFTIDP
ncbi:MAG: GC-type dockerin domain-anchored protein [Phycisphaerales bacterium JB060]